MNEKRKKLLLLWSCYTIGILLGTCANFFIHEAGHYVPAYIFNSSNVVEFKWSLETCLKYLEGQAKTGDFQVGFKEQYFPFGYSILQASIISVSGLLFQFILLLIFALGLKRYSNKDKNSYLTGFFVGAYFSSISILVSWIADIDAMLRYFQLYQVETIILMGISLVVIIIYLFLGYTSAKTIIEPQLNKIDEFIKSKFRS